MQSLSRSISVAGRQSTLSRRTLPAMREIFDVQENKEEETVQETD
jgi:hypothetical protein